jgi:hypothetical protein
VAGHLLGGGSTPTQAGRVGCRRVPARPLGTADGTRTSVSINLCTHTDHAAVRWGRKFAECANALDGWVAGSCRCSMQEWTSRSSEQLGMIGRQGRQHQPDQCQCPYGAPSVPSQCTWPLYSAARPTLGATTLLNVQYNKQGMPTCHPPFVSLSGGQWGCCRQGYGACPQPCRWCTHQPRTTCRRSSRRRSHKP